MNNTFKWLVLACLTPWFAGCATAHQDIPPTMDIPPTVEIPVVEPARQPISDVATYALGLINTPYKYGGNTPDGGLDCSGFVIYVFQKVLNQPLPRTSHEIAGVGAKISKNDLLPGDLVFFNTRRQTHSHVGIYIGNGRFVHAPGYGKAIRLASLNQKYWRNRFDAARRITGNSASPQSTPH